MTQLTDPERDYPPAAVPTDYPIVGAMTAGELAEPDLSGYPEGTTYSRYLVAAQAVAGQVMLPYPHSINELVATQDRQRSVTHDIRGKLLLFPRTGMIMMPVAINSGGWGCVVVHGGTRTYDDGRQMYPRGGYDLHVGDEEIANAVEVVLTVNGLTTEAAPGA